MSICVSIHVVSMCVLGICIHVWVHMYVLYICVCCTYVHVFVCFIHMHASVCIYVLCVIHVCVIHVYLYVPIHVYIIHVSMCINTNACVTKCVFVPRLMSSILGIGHCMVRMHHECACVGLHM